MANPVAKRTTVLLMRGVKSRPPGKGCHDTYAWENRDAQTTYFQKKAVYSVEGNSYQRIYDGTFRCKIDETTLAANNLYTCNYMLFDNNLYEAMRVYAWITGVRYVANGTLEIDYIIDDIQTFYFNYSERACFVERMTWNYAIDTPGANLQPEPVNPGEPVVYGYDRYGLESGVTHGWRLIIGTTYDPFDSTVSYQTSIQGGIPTAVKYVQFEVIPYEDGGKAWIEYVHSDGSTISTDTLSKWLTQITEANEFDAIISATLVPRDFAIAWGDRIEAGGYLMKNVQGRNADTAIQGYIPRHKKLYTAPYMFMRCANGLGDTIDLYYEYFQNPDNPGFEIIGTLNQNMTVYCCPIGYNGAGIAQAASDYGISLGTFPAVAIATDSFKAWLAQNQGKLVSGAVNTVIGGVAEIVKNPIAGILNLITGAVDTAGEFWDKSRQPATVKGSQADGTALVSGIQDFWFYKMVCRPEYLKACDQFFDMFGYATNQVLSPVRLQGRYYSYWKTAGCIVDGDIPADANSRICSIYDAGVRFWRDEQFGVYVRDKLN